MENNLYQPRSLVVSTQFYRALLTVYPSAFRQEYGAPMLQLFRDCCQRALATEGTSGLLSLWLRTILDTVQAALEEHTQRGIDMSKEKFIKLSGWGLVLSGLVLTLGWLASSRPEYEPYNFLSQPIDRIANAATIPLFVAAALLLSMGTSGLFLRYRQAVGSFAGASLVVGAISGVVSALGALGLGIFDSEFWWLTFFFGLVIEFLALALFGIANLRQRVLPRWNGLPLLAGIWVPLFVLTSLIYEQFLGGTWLEFPGPLNITIWLVNLVCLVCLGYVLQLDPRPAELPATAA